MAGTDWSRFVSWMNQQVSPIELARMQRKWAQSKYQRNPQLKLQDIEKIFEKQIEEHQKGRTPKQIQSNKESAVRMIKALQRKKEIDNIYDRDPETGKYRKIDLSKFYGVEGKAIIKPRGKKVEALVKAGKKELPEPGEEIFTPKKMSGQIKKLVRTLERQIKVAKEKGDIEALKTNQEFLEKLESGFKAGDFNNLTAYRQIRKAIEEQEKLSRMSIKDDEYLKRSLQLQGVDTSNLRTTKQIRDAVRAFNRSLSGKEKDRLIGLRYGQVNREEMISDLTRNSRIPKSAYEQMTTEELKNEWKRIAPFKTKKKDFFMTNMFPRGTNIDEKIKSVNKFYQEEGLKPLTREQKKAIKLQLKKSKPWLSGDEFKKEYAKELYSRAYDKKDDVTVPEKEIWNRLMYWKYKDPNRLPSPKDQLEFIQLIKKDRRKFNRIIDRIGPGIMADGSLSGPYKPDIETIPSKIVTEFKQNLTKSVDKIEASVKEQEAQAEKARMAERLKFIQMKYPF